MPKDYEYLVDIPESELTQHVVKVKAGDKEAIGHVITAHIKLVHRVCARYIYKYPYKREDIISSGMLGLTQAVVWASQGRLIDLQITPYIVATVKRFIKDFLETDHLIPIPRHAFKEFIEKMTIPEFLPITMSMSQVSHPDDEENYLEDAFLSHDKHIDNEVPLEELLDALDLSEFEKQVAIMKADGYTVREIGWRFEKSHVWIIKVLDEIEAKCRRIGAKA